ncbi:MAG: hemolysin family protein [Candidatus Peregrinibacteria bacterium]|nr:hemolysin family protein [Candidatus Peregrinibacteria bacterium]
MVLLLILSGFFSGTEIALFSLGPEKIQALKKSAKTPKERNKITRLEVLKSDPNTLLVTILVGNNFVNIFASALATLTAVNFAKDLGYAENSSLVIGTVTGVMTFAILLFGEIIPKSFAHKHALRFSMIAAPVLSVLQILLFPVVFPLSKLVKKFSGGELKHGMSENELKAAIELSEKEGKIESDEKELVEKVLEFDTHDVDSVMTPRSKIFSLSGDLSTINALPQITEAGFSRIPISGKNSDDIIGILTVHLCLDESQKKGFENKKISDLPLLEVFKIPPTMKIDSLLKEFQNKKTHMAIVYDEHGGIVGVITLEDVIEEVFGEFLDENDEEFFIHRKGRNKFLCDGEIELEHIEKYFIDRMVIKSETNMPWKLSDENKTLAGFLLEKFEKFPNVTEEITVKNHEMRVTFTIKKVEDQKIKKVEILIR